MHQIAWLYYFFQILLVRETMDQGSHGHGKSLKILEKEIFLESHGKIKKSLQILDR